MAAAAEAVVLAPTATALPTPPADDFMTPHQWETLYALLDGILPAIVPQSKARSDGTQLALPDDEFEKLVDEALPSLPEGQTREAFIEHLASRPAADPGVRDDVLRTLNKGPGKKALAGLMDMLNTRLGSIAFTGCWDPITKQSTATRHSIMKSWQQSRFAFFRDLCANMGVLAVKGLTMTNGPFADLIGYTDAPKDWQSVEGYPFNFIQPGPGNEPYVLDTDIVIVGSGPGGGVSAKNLSEAGHRVLVVDKGYYFPPSQLPMSQTAGSQHLFDTGGPMMTDDASMSVTAGSAWGGGGTVNWSVCLRTQDFVRQEWADEGLTMYGSKDYDDCMDRVWETIGAGTDAIRHNHRNKILLEASDKLGWKAAPVAQNTASKEHYCGRCHLGCGSGEKQGPAICWLPAAAEAGAEFMEGFHADKVVFGEDGKTAVGVEGTWLARSADGDWSVPDSDRMKRKVQIRAKRVIVSGGTIRSPILLMNSGVENPQLGKNLHMHPASLFTAAFPEQTDGWEGGIITGYNGEFENLDGKGHGAKLEAACMVPYIPLASYPWTDGVSSKLLLSRASRLATLIAITRDRDTGHVFPDPKSGRPRIVYQISDFDRESSTEGLIAIAKICYVSGAKDLQAYIPGLETHVIDPVAQKSFNERLARGEVKDPEFTDVKLAKWIEKLRKVIVSQPMKGLVNAHQMGTCRMATDGERGVVDEYGKVWGHEGLYVADGSVLPSASGVNPMVTIMATADWISRGIAKGLKA